MEFQKSIKYRIIYHPVKFVRMSQKCNNYEETFDHNVMCKHVITWISSAWMDVKSHQMQKFFLHWLSINRFHLFVTEKAILSLYKRTNGLHSIKQLDWPSRNFIVTKMHICARRNCIYKCGWYCMCCFFCCVHHV